MCIRLLYRKLALRILLTSAIARLPWGIYFLTPNNEWRIFLGPTLLRLVGLPLAIILHQVMRLWRIRWWLTICELLLSLLEIITVIIYGAIPNIQLIADIAHQNLGLYNALVALIVLLPWGLELVMVTSSFICFVFLLWDVLGHCGSSTIRYFLQPYEFLPGSQQSGYQWKFLFGQFITRKRFSTDNLLTRCVRGGFAILLAVGIFCLAFYASIWQPLQWGDRPGVKKFKMSTATESLWVAVGGLAPSEYVYDRGWPLRAALALPIYPSMFNQYPTLSMNLTRFYGGEIFHINQACIDTKTQQAVVVDCPVILPDGDFEAFEMLFTIKFSGMQGDFRLYLGLHSPTDQVEEVLSVAEPIGLGPGLNLHGWSSIAVKDRLSDQKAATFGIQKYRRVVVINVRAVSPDWLPSIPRDDDTATLRVTMQLQSSLEIEQEYMEGSVLSGLAVVGGIWTLVNGTFAAIFGSTLLLVLFGIKPLSIYGLIHYLRPGKGSLVDRGYVLSPEERDRVVGIFREHLLDLDDTEKYRTPPISYKTIDALPQFDRACHSEVGVQAC